MIFGNTIQYLVLLILNFFDLERLILNITYYDIIGNNNLVILSKTKLY